MAVIKQRPAKRKAVTTKPSTLQALTGAAMLLPGMLSTTRAADTEVTIQYGHYEEGKRDIYGFNFNAENFQSETIKVINHKPITVDSVHLQAKSRFFDRFNFTANYTQDTWSGATPIATGPVGFGGNRIIENGDGTITGASPYVETLTNIVFDADNNPLWWDGVNTNTGELLYSKDSRLVHTLVMASPETRKQGDFQLSYEWDTVEVNVGGGISIEHDYQSRFVNWGGKLDLNNKLTTLNFSQSYTNSTTSALFDHDVLPYLSKLGYEQQIFNTPSKVVDESVTLKGEREDWAHNFSITQVLNKNALVELGAGYTHSTGFMENPYKLVYVFYVSETPNAHGVFDGSTIAFIEKRPDERNQWNFNLRYVQHIEPLDASFNLKYNYFHDDWGINAHTLEGSWIQPLGAGWTVTPTIRYYSQDAADFYTPYLVTRKKAVGLHKEDPRNYDNIPADNFSSDHRLSGYGALSGGVVITKQFAKGVTLEMGFEYYTHEGGLKLGGDGEDAYADFTSYSANAALKVDIGSIGQGLAYSSHGQHGHEHGSPVPAGVMSAHMLDTAGDWMIGYRYMYGRQAGDMLQGNNKISDSSILASSANCGGTQCFVAPDNMTMNMHMFNIMYAPTDWLNLMLMPTYMDMSMNFRGLDGASRTRPPGVINAITHAGHEHITGGVGDTQISALFKLYDDNTHHLHLGLGVSAPTGDVKIELRRSHKQELGLIHYGMQVGSGTWDFTPNLTYTGQSENWAWGAQISGIKRLESQNEVGYRLGDLFQSSAWGSYKLFNWLSMSVRGIYTSQGALHGDYNELHIPIGPMDSPQSYGGEYWDLGFGLNASVPTGDLMGNSLSVEWIQPIEDDVNGFQLERDGSLSVNWSYMF